MIFSEEEITGGLLRIGRSPDAKFLVQKLLNVLLSVTGPGISNGALERTEGARNFASELIKALDYEQGRDGGRHYDNGSAAELARRQPGVVRNVTGSGIRRRVPIDPADDAGN
jgi:hypothetical protein